MSKLNGTDARVSQKKIALKDGLNIVATGDGLSKRPSEVQLILQVPGAKKAARVLIFPEPKPLRDVIEMLIAYRRYVFPDAPEVDITKTVEDAFETMVTEE